MKIQQTNQAPFVLTLFALLLTWSICFNQATAAVSFGEKEIDIISGEVKIIEMPGITRVAVGNGALLNAQAIKNSELVLIGQAPGVTNLQVWHGDQRSRYRINIHTSKPEQDITMRKIISTKVRIIEFREQSLKKIGIDWANGSVGPSFFAAKDFISTPTLALTEQATQTLSRVGSTGNAPLFFGSSIALNSTINLMQTSGHAITLAEPTLSSLSGESAQFLAGGEIPFSFVDTDGRSSVTFKEYGIKLNVSPTADRRGRISTEIQTEVSAVDGSIEVGGAPGFLTRKTDTHMNVLSGQTIVIAGLLTKNTQENLEYIPGLAGLPLIGDFFKTKNFSEEKTQLVIFVTPTMIDPNKLHEQTTSLTQQTSRQYRLADQELEQILNSGLAEITVDIEG